MRNVEIIKAVINMQGGFPSVMAEQQFDELMDIVVSYVRARYGKDGENMAFGPFIAEMAILATEKLYDDVQKDNGELFNVEMESLLQTEIGNSDIF